MFATSFSSPSRAVTRRVLTALAVAVTVGLCGCANLFSGLGSPDAVLDLNAEAGDARVTLTWTDPPNRDFDHCTVYYRSAAGTDAQFAGAVSASGTTVAGLTNGVAHTFTVYAVDRRGRASEGSSVDAVPQASGSPEEPVDTVPPGPVTELAAGGRFLSAELSWTNPADADFTEVVLTYGPTGAAHARFDGPLDPAGSLIDGLSGDVEYTFTVVAVDEAGNESAPVSVDRKSVV